MAHIVAEICGLLRDRTGLNTIVLSGDVFMNSLLARKTLDELEEGHFNVYCHRRMPPNDGGLCLGQAAIAAALTAESARHSTEQREGADHVLGHTG
jgi:hydrogenase maturation protein HypF